MRQFFLVTFCLVGLVILGFLALPKNKLPGGQNSFSGAINYPQPRLNPEAVVWSQKGSLLAKEGRYSEALSCFENALKLNPDFAVAWDEKGMVLQSLGRYPQALKCHEQAISLNPANLFSWVEKGLTLENLGRYREAIVCFEKVIRQNPNSLNAWFEKGVSLEKLGNPEGAKKCFAQLVELKPDSAEAKGAAYAWLEKGLFQEKLGNLKAAEKFYLKAVSLSSLVIEDWYERGYALGKLGKQNESIRVLKISRRLAEKVKSAELIRDIDQALQKVSLSRDQGSTLLDGEKYQEALQYYNRVLAANPRNANAWVKKGETLTWLAKPEAAIDCYDRAIALDPENSLAWYQRGRITRVQLGDAEAAIKYLKQVIALKDISPQKLVADAWLEIGLCTETLVGKAAAVNYYNKALALVPNHAAMHRKGIMLCDLGDSQDALDCFDQLWALASPQDDPKDLRWKYSASWYEKGYTVMRQGRFKEAIKYYSKAAAINPYDADTWFEKGFCFSLLGSYGEAVKNFEKALALKPNDPEYWVEKGYALEKEGKITEATLCYRKILALDYHKIKIQPCSFFLPINIPKVDQMAEKAYRLQITGKLSEANKYYTHAITIDHTAHDRWHARGYALAKLGQTGEAIYSLKIARVLTEKRQDPLAYSNLEDIDNLLARLKQEDFRVGMQDNIRWKNPLKVSHQ